MRSKMVRSASVLVLSLLASLTALIGSPLCQEAEQTGQAIPMDPPPGPPTKVVAVDNPNDSGNAIQISWQASADDGAGEFDVINYQILRGEIPGDISKVVGEVLGGTTEFIDVSVTRGMEYYYRIAANDASSQSLSELAGPVMARRQWFNMSRLNMFIAEVILAGSILYFIL